MTRSGRKYSALLQPSKSIRVNSQADQSHLPFNTKKAGGSKANIIKAPCRNSDVTVSNDKITDNVPEITGNSKMTKHHRSDLAMTSTFCFICIPLSFRSAKEAAKRTSQPPCPYKGQRVYCYITYFMIF